MGPRPLAAGAPRPVDVAALIQSLQRLDNVARVLRSWPAKDGPSIPHTIKLALFDGGGKGWEASFQAGCLLQATKRRERKGNGTDDPGDIISISFRPIGLFQVFQLRLFSEHCGIRPQPTPSSRRNTKNLEYPLTQVERFTPKSRVHVLSLSQQHKKDHKEPVFST